MSDVPALVSFSTPLLALGVLPLLLLLIWQAFRSRDNGALQMTGLEYLGAVGRTDGRRRKYFQIGSRLVLVAGLAVVLAGPVYQSGVPLFGQHNKAFHKNFIIAFDMSPSMNLPASSKGFGGEDLKEGEGGITRYEMARDALFDFIDYFKGERFGLVLFSTEPFFARWPTTEMDNRFGEVLESIRRGAGTQLESFSSLTNIDKGLLMARDAFEGSEGAIILISDAEDDLENLGRGVRSLLKAGIRLYTLGISIPDETLKKIAQAFADDPGFRIFRADSEQEMQQAYRLVGEIEESPMFENEAVLFETDLRGVLSIVLALMAIILLAANEILFHQTLSARQFSHPVMTTAHGI